jgi:Protein of unknown function (DUF2752)
MSQAAVHQNHDHGVCTGHAPVWRRSALMELPIIGRVVGLLVALAVLVPLVPGYPGVTCPLRALTGVPCPFCGTTTSLRELTQFDVLGSLAANPVGVLAAIALLAIFFARRTHIRVPILLLIGLPLVLWLYQMHRFALVG